MSLFGAIVRTTINVVSLPVMLPVAVMKDVGDKISLPNKPADNTKKLIQQLKDEADSDE